MSAPKYAQDDESTQPRRYSTSKCTLSSGLKGEVELWVIKEFGSGRGYRAIAYCSTEEDTKAVIAALYAADTTPQTYAIIRTALGVRNF